MTTTSERNLNAERTIARFTELRSRHKDNKAFLRAAARMLEDPSWDEGERKLLKRLLDTEKTFDLCK